SWNQYGVYVMVEPLLAPCYTINDTYGFGVEIIDAMRDHVIGRNRAYGMQRFAWPHVVTGNSMIIVGHEMTGKTMSYLPQICSVALKEMDVRPANDPGPAAIIVCYSQVQGRQIAAWIDQLMRPTCERKNRVGCLTLYERSDVIRTSQALKGMVGILLTTAELMLHLKEFNCSILPILRPETVKCVAWDNFGDLVRVQPVTTGKLIHWFTRNYCFNGRTENPCQLFVTGRVWDKQMHTQILRYLINPLVIFEDALEAAACKGVHIELGELPENVDGDKLLIKILGEINLSKSRTVVVCQNHYDAIYLRREILKARIGAVACYQETTGMPLVAHWRSSYNGSVLIVTDDIMHKVRSGIVDILIHYNAATTWVRFKARFGLFYDSYVLKQDPPGKSYVLVRRSETDYIWLLCDFMLKHQYPRPSTWLQVLFEHRLKMNLRNRLMPDISLCRHLTSYGDCFRRNCRYRHFRWIGEKAVVPDIDIRVGDTILFHILTCNNPSMMAIRLSGKFPASHTFLRMPMTRMRHHLHLKYENDESLRVKHQNPKPGDIVVVKNMYRYERVVVTAIEAKDKKIEVRLLDSGIEHLTYNPSQLYVCTPEFLMKPHEAIQLHIIGLEPTSMERIWPDDFRMLVRHEFFPRWQYMQESIYTAKVEFVLNNAVYVSTIIDDKGQDLCAFVQSRFQVNLDPEGLKKLHNMVQRSVPRP
ncbi:hypothetical protein KR074_008638, partial [Drosophila pseudoananassae]